VRGIRFFLTWLAWLWRTRRNPGEQVPDVVRDTCADIRIAFGNEPAIEELEYLVEEVHRKKKLRRIVMKLPGDMTGAVFPLPDCDLILEQEGLNYVLMLITRLHELGHLLLGHVELVNPNLPCLDIFLSDPYKYLEYALSRTQALPIYTLPSPTRRDSPIEVEAEAFAREQFPGVYRHHRVISSLARELYGE
jgi:hypothetical protein